MVRHRLARLRRHTDADGEVARLFPLACCPVGRWRPPLARRTCSPQNSASSDLSVLWAFLISQQQLQSGTAELSEKFVSVRKVRKQFVCSIESVNFQTMAAH